jgi:N-acetylglucosaminyl-diphospho-decaprenol L-rhamnosyltransferase
MTKSSAAYRVTVIVLNYNGKRWVDRCLESLKNQTIFEQVQVIIADNASIDGSDNYFEKRIADWANGLFIQNGANIGFAAGSNRAVRRAKGKYLFFLNPDVWLENNCIEELYQIAEENQSAAVGPFVMDYDDNTYQSFGGVGFDMCGLGVPVKPGGAPRRLFMSNGFVFIRRDTFDDLGGYNEQFFLYGEEADLSWRIWISGGEIVPGITGRIHHRGGASVNPEGGTRIVEFRTSDAKRFHANRNNMLVLLYHAQHFLLLLLFPMLCLFLLEAAVGTLFARRWSFFQTTFLNVIRESWRLRRHIADRRRFIKTLRRRSDFWMLRFFTLRLSHWEDFKRVFKLGLPRVDK